MKSERSAPFWFVLVIIALSLRNAGVEIFASGLRAQEVQREGSQTPKRACTERGVTLSKTGAHPKAGDPGRGGPAETPGPAELRIHLAYGLLLPSAPRHMLAACHADWWRDVIPSMTRSHLMPTDRSGDAHGAAGSSGSFSLSSLSPACLCLCLTRRLLSRSSPCRSPGRGGSGRPVPGLLSPSSPTPAARTPLPLWGDSRHGRTLLFCLLLSISTKLSISRYLGR